MPDVDIIGIAEASEILGRDRTMVHRYIREHRLPIVTKLGSATGAYVLDRAAVEALKAELDGEASTPETAA